MTGDLARSIAEAWTGLAVTAAVAGDPHPALSLTGGLLLRRPPTIARIAHAWLNVAPFEAAPEAVE